MEIKRSVDGIERTFMLTDNELYNAYREQEHIWDKNNIENNMDYLDFPYNVLLADNEKFINDAAWELRRNIDKYDMQYCDAVREAVREVGDEYIDGEFVSKFIKEHNVEDTIDATGTLVVFVINSKTDEEEIIGQAKIAEITLENTKNEIYAIVRDSLDYYEWLENLAANKTED